MINYQYDSEYNIINLFNRELRSSSHSTRLLSESSLKPVLLYHLIIALNILPI